MHPLIETIYKSGHVEDADGNPRDAFPVAIQYEDGMALYSVMRASGVKRTLEIGMAFGLSSLFVMQGLHENQGEEHTSVDPWQEKWWNKDSARSSVDQRRCIRAHCRARVRVPRTP